ncbi:uncharacterized protein LOC129973068 [Argiope bruennichi]|uniref:uncharacterized protein LOC129973068 n=1 Tax=Argiope bruennichi TaxID=94029 RepID=UPI0024946B8D|nr:uncharacterized protein LOC129973068 [Argiope bruennichi]
MSAFEKDSSEYDGHESSDFPKMSEQLTDSNSLQSGKTYEGEKNSGSLFPPVSQETTPVCTQNVNTSVADDHHTQDDNQAVSCGKCEDLANPGPCTSSNNHSSVNTTTSLENRVCHKQEVRDKPFFTSRAVIFEQCANDFCQKTQNVCILKLKEIADEAFSREPRLKDMTVRDYFQSPGLAGILSDYLNDCVGIPSNYQDVNKGYDFPENFETEKLLNVIKSFVHCVIFHIIPKDGPIPINVSYSQIMNAIVHKMSVREGAITLCIFGKMSSLEMIKVDNVLSKLNFVALLVIFDEYKRRQIT